MKQKGRLLVILFLFFGGAYYFKDAFCPVVRGGLFGQGPIPILSYLVAFTIVSKIFSPNTLFYSIHDMKYNLLPWNWYFRKSNTAEIQIGKDMINKGLVPNNLLYRVFAGNIGRKSIDEVKTATELKDIFDNKGYSLTEVA
jgi:hypothetical protein